MIELIVGEINGDQLYSELKTAGVPITTLDLHAHGDKLIIKAAPVHHMTVTQVVAAHVPDYTFDDPQIAIDRFQERAVIVP